MPGPQQQDDPTPNPEQSDSSMLSSLPSLPSILQPEQQISQIPFLFFPPLSASLPHTLPPPTIHRLIPASGPTHGGIEVTVLGANFHSSLQLNCVFGDTLAGSTQRWSDNALVCVLPPRDRPGVVGVWFEGMKEIGLVADGPPSLFTYTDESDRAL